MQFLVLLVLFLGTRLESRPFIRKNKHPPTHARFDFSQLVHETKNSFTRLQRKITDFCQIATPAKYFLVPIVYLSSCVVKIYSKFNNKPKTVTKHVSEVPETKREADITEKTEKHRQTEKQAKNKPENKHVYKSAFFFILLQIENSPKPPLLLHPSPPPFFQ